MLVSFLSSLHKSSVVKVHVLLPYNIAICTQTSYTLSFNLKERPLVTNKGRSSLNFAQPVLIQATTLSELLPPLLTWFPK
uniref:Uncharacterized protein n=1 Tax=Octopus bimaculoides TaxID=37653 RepID=A0A0L8GID1_OCTBM